MSDDASWQSLSAQVAQLREFVERLAARVDRESRIAAIMAGTGRPSPLSPRPRRKRDRHGLHIVRGLVTAPFLALGGWLARPVHRRVLAGAALMATAAGGSLAPDVIAPAPAAPAPARHHAVAHHRHRQAPVMLLPAVPARRKRHRPNPGKTAAASAPPRPSPSAAPSPSPSIIPSPLPPIPPPPSPDPSCLHLTGRHCHDGVLGEAEAATRAVRGLTGLPWLAMPWHGKHHVPPPPAPAGHSSPSSERELTTASVRLDNGYIDAGQRLCVGPLVGDVVGIPVGQPGSKGNPVAIRAEDRHVISHRCLRFARLGAIPSAGQ